MSEMYEGKKKKSKKGLRIFLVILLVFLIMSVIFVGTLFGYIYSKWSKVQYYKLEHIEINEGVAEQLKGYRNIAVFGVDTRSNSYSNTRSDIIMIISLNQDTNKVKVASVYRDTYVYIDGHGYDKINHAYAYGGPELAVNTLNKNLDLNIQEFVTVNFNAVIDIVDSIGGLDIEVTAEEVGYMNKYIQDINKELGRNDSPVSGSGTKHLTGAQALAYSRVRYTSGGDFKRAERSRIVLNKTFEKAKHLSVGQLNKLSDILLPKICTNITASDIIGMIPNLGGIKMNEGEGWPYKTQFYNNGVSYVAPVTLETNVKMLHENLFGNSNYEVSSKVKEYSEGIIKKTGYR